MQRDIDVLQRQLARQGVPLTPGAAAMAGAGGGVGLSQDYIAQTEGRFADLDAQLREFTSRIEELTYKLDQLTTRVDKLVGDVDYRLGALERGGGAAGTGATGTAGAVTPGAGTAGSTTPGAAAAPSAATPAPGAPALGAPQVQPGQPRLVLVPGGPAGQIPQSPAAPVALPQGSPDAQYKFAYDLLVKAQQGQSDFSEPEQAFRAFVAANPNHRLTGNAQYWLGETYYVRRDFQNAARAFAEGVQKYPTGEKAPDNLLKLGMSLGQLNQKANACGALVEVDRRYPNAVAGVKQAAARERQRLGCS
ncbi:MAG: tol-pal system protein YbgF [Proteobacteria bacterium]|nr:tol-pal system protein YbgF [Pseudomonadota bacterium]